ncbi:MAG: hypothetical protein AAF673_03620 [Pseudomonadota bacterium]
MNNHDVKIIYIAGYGRSGSTLIDRFISSNISATGCGELARLFFHAHQESVLGLCSCKSPYVKCPLWGPLLEKIRRHPLGGSFEELDRLTQKIETTHPKKLDVSLSFEFYKYKWLWQTVFSYIQKKTGNKVVLDSSKTTPRGGGFRPFYLSKILDSKVLMLHLTRHPTAVLNSVSKGSNKRLEDKRESDDNKQIRLMKSWFSWRGSNNIAYWLGRQKFIYRVGVNYEKFCESPESFKATLINTVEELWPETSQIGSSSKIYNAEIDNVDHGVGGNRMRRNKVHSIQIDNQWKKSATPFVKVLGGINYMWMNNFYQE